MSRPGLIDDAWPAGAVRPHLPSRVRGRSDVLGLTWTAAAAAAVLVRALHPGVTLGPFDLLLRFGLTRRPGSLVHNAVQADQIKQFVPWMDLTWHQVHAGHLPLWNPDNVLGMPLAFNWQSGVFSLPALVAYAVPVAYAYAAMVLVKLVVAGAGAYVLCRSLGMGPLAAAFGGTAFELSGPMVAYAGWSHVTVTCWAGWILAAIVLIVRGERRLLGVALLAISFAMAIFGGHPESLIVLSVCAVLFAGVLLAVRARTEGGPVLRPLRDLVVGALCGVGLGAPLIFPGTQVAALSSRGSGTAPANFPLSHVVNLVVAGAQGSDFRTTAYVGVVVLALVVVGVGMAWSRPAVSALVLVGVVGVLLTFFSPADRLLHVVPGGRTVYWSRIVMILALVLAVLAAFGVDALTRARSRGPAVVWATWAFLGVALVVSGLAVAGQIGLAPALARRPRTLVWPAAEAVAGACLAGAWWWRSSSNAGREHTPAWWPRSVPLALLGLETAFLLSVGIPSWSVSRTYFPTNAAVTAVHQRVGNSLVGYSTCRTQRFQGQVHHEVGIRPDANIGYGLHVMAVYDPIIPARYFRGWSAISGQPIPPPLQNLGIFCPRITTIDEARLFGVRYVLAPAASAIALRGARTPVGDEVLISVPGSAQATLTKRPSAEPLPVDATGTPVAVTHPDPASWRLVLRPASESILRLRLTAIPGWHATIDGRPLTLGMWASGMMFDAVVPSGRHVIDLHYWPSAFTAGLAVAGMDAATLVTVTFVISATRRRRRRSNYA